MNLRCKLWSRNPHTCDGRFTRMVADNASKPSRNTEVNPPRKYLKETVRCRASNSCRQLLEWHPSCTERHRRKLIARATRIEELRNIKSRRNSIKYRIRRRLNWLSAFEKGIPRMIKHWEVKINQMDEMLARAQDFFKEG